MKGCEEHRLWFLKECRAYISLPLQEGGWMKYEGGGIFVYTYIMKASAHNQSLVERVPAGRVFSLCKLSIRSEEQKYKEASVKDRIPIAEDKGVRFLQRSKWDLPTFSTLFVVFNMSFSLLFQLCLLFELIIPFPCFSCYYCLSGPCLGWVGEEVYHWKNGATFSTIVFLFFLLDGFIFLS